MKTIRIVIAGGPGSGKTSLIDHLEEKGYPCMHEISREITREGRKQGVDYLFLDEPLLFSKRLIEGRVRQFEDAARFPGAVFFDRGLPDVLAYLDAAGQKYPGSFDVVCQEHLYDKVFLLPPWKAIFTKDDERYEDFKESEQLYGYLKGTYQRFGYKPIEVPKAGVGERVEFVIRQT